ncbi:MAG TPA: Type 1 glutamine amidotransferase-like domain-containing protein [Candidatus Saccharimonadales bacterium]|nr:Type 1 glutamine amidotransferase-like domain-containing protein [Candidatus Saccharimonadales bacterium]
MKLFLSALMVNDSQVGELEKLAGKRAREIKIALIEDATEPYPEGEAWIDENLKTLKGFGFDVELVDLKKYKAQLVKFEVMLGAKDVVWLGGGNTFYLRWILKDVGVDKIITKHVKDGSIVFGGDSAGAIVAGPTLKYFDAADDPNDSPAVVLNGLDIIKQVVVPHMDNEKFVSVINGINDSLKKDDFETIPLNDGQALIIDGDMQKII